MLISLAILITNEYISKINLRYTKLRNWIDVFTNVYQKTINQFMIDEKIDEKEALGLKKFYNHYFDKRKDITNSTEFRIEIFVDVKSKGSFLPEQRTKPNFWQK